MLTLVHKDYGRATSLSSITEKFIHSSPSSISDDDYYGSPEKLPPLSSGVNATKGSRANATFVILARNSDLEGTIRAVRSIEDRFNRDYRYPYVFLNDEPFSEDFKRFVQFPLLNLFVFYLTNYMALTVEFRFSAELQWSLGWCRQNTGISLIG
jgi:Glycolipid 2-alpha-mannosyltransferase